MKKRRNKNRPIPFLQKNLSFDIVIPVHNALEDLRKCLESIYQNSESPFRLIIINDGSDHSTSLFLNEFAKSHSNLFLIENPLPRGYTKAANQGLKEINADFAVLMNSDLIVPEGWLKRLAEPALNDKSVGLIGPVSNAATWQSVPERFDLKGSWAINDLPEGMDINGFDKIVTSVSVKRFPQVPVLNGFCTLICKEVFGKIGYLDEESFPSGYGEENDFCLRAGKAGFKLVVNDSVYIFHAKSKSFGHKKRLQLSEEGGKKLLEKYGKEAIDNAVKSLRDNIYLKEIREKIFDALKKKEKLRNSPSINSLSPDDKNKLKVLFILPIAGVAGGIHSIVQEVSGMRELGVEAKIATWHHFKDAYFTVYSELENKNDLFYFFGSFDELVEYSSGYDVAAATIHSSILLLKKIYDSNPHILPAYYIQDYEPFFFEKDSEDWKIAYDSYTLIPEALLFAKTKWLCDVVNEIHKVKVEKVSPSLDQKVYFPEIRKSKDFKELQITAMIRPSTPRRGAARTMRVLKRIKGKHGSKVKIKIFGTSDEHLQLFDLVLDFEFENAGVLNREQVASLLKESDIFLDFSIYQAFGRTGLEAMACGCAAVLPVKGGINEYAVNKENSMLADTGNDDECFRAVDLLVEDNELREKIKSKGILKSAEYSIRKAALSELLLFRDYIHMKKTFPKTNCEASLIKTGVDEFLKEGQKIRYDLLTVLLFLKSYSRFNEKYFSDLKKSLRVADKIMIVDLGTNEEEKAKFLDYINDKKNITWISAGSKRYSEAVLICIERSNTPYIAAINYGSEFPQNWLKKLSFYFSSPRVASVSSLLYSNESGFAGLNDSINAELSQLLKKTKDLTEINSELEKNFNGTGHSVMFAGSNFTIYKKVLLNKLGNPGNLNQKLFELYVSWKFRSSGYSLITALDCAVKIHPGSFAEDHPADDGQLLSMLRYMEKFYGENNLPEPEEIWGIKLPKLPGISFNKNSRVGDIKTADYKEFESVKQDLVSIIIVTYNQLEYSKRCIDSVKEKTSSLYELIIVDNASTDDTVEYLKTLLAEKEITVIFNKENTGYPKAVNEGIKHARGNYILLLNNDTVVTKNWLSYLIDKINKEEKIGLAGPVSNEVSGVQKISVNYGSIEEMHEFSEKREKIFRGKFFEFPRIAFLCTLIKKEVIEKIGGLDERFSPGNFEDDDFCLRAQLAGYKTIVAEDVFIHHFGSRSFKAEGGGKYSEQLQINKEKFTAKWGADPEEIWIKGKNFRKREIRYPVCKDLFKESFERVQIHVRENEYEPAASEILRAVENYPENNEIKFADLLNLGGNIFMMIHDYERSQKFFEEALKADPSSSHACTGLGELFFIYEMYGESKTMFEWGVKNNPANKTAQEGLIKINRILGLEAADLSAETLKGQQ